MPNHILFPLSCFFIFMPIEFICACPPSLDSLNLPPPVMHQECLTRNSCRRGYICRLNRCVGGKALASKTKQMNYKNLENYEKMEKCCQEQMLPERCMPFCSMRSFNEFSIFRLLSEPYRCPMSSLQTIHACASQNMNHQECCQQNAIPSNCMDLCVPINSSSALMSKLHCLKYLSIIRNCFQSKNAPKKLY